ncbi:MAG: DUF1631 family protein [Comamonadaceae bacterium]|nr:MAG: DUF1631 family protein [Comamonadaceae bacterium]
MTPPLPVLTEALQACLKEAFAELPRLTGRWCDRVLTVLYEHAMLIPDSAEKHRLHEALTSLKKNRSTIEQQLAPAVSRAVMEELRPGGASSEGGRSFSSLSFDELELMGDSQVQTTIDSARVHQVTRLACESGFSDFSARFSTVQGFAAVKADRNPLRPEVFSQTLIKLMQGLPVDGEARSRWMVHGAHPLGDELQALYMRLGGQLARAGIAPAAYAVLSAPDEKSGRKADVVQLNAAAQNQAAQPGAPKHAAISSVLTLDHLHRLLVGEYDDSFPAPSPFDDMQVAAASHAEFSHTVPAAMDLLVELKEKGAGSAATPGSNGPQRINGVAAAVTPLSPETAAEISKVRARFKTEAKSLGQSLAIEVVGMMISQMANDTRLLLPVRSFIASVEPAFLNLAVADPRFFSDKSHPARRLLETITGKSLAYASEEAPGFEQFMKDLVGIAVALRDGPTHEAQHFALLLELFEQLQARQAAQASQAQSRAVQALLQAEQRNLLAGKIAAEIRARPDYVGGSRVISAFLTGPWSQVMANERLLGEQGGLGARKAVYSLTLGELLWSINIEQASQHRKRLVRIIPEMLKAIREGLLSIDYPLEKSKDFFDELMAIHQEALKPAAATDLKVVSRARLEKEFAAGDEGRDQHWMAPTEAQDSGFMDNDLGMDTRPLQDEPGDAPYKPSAAAIGADVVDSLHLKVGDWVELMSDTQWLRAQLSWISPYYTLFMFTSDGGRQHSMTSQVLQHLLKIGLVKVVSQRGVLDGALDSVARTAVQNSVQTKDGN